VQIEPGARTDLEEIEGQPGFRGDGHESGGQDTGARDLVGLRRML
jgi:hypothetical protein